MGRVMPPSTLDTIERCDDVAHLLRELLCEDTSHTNRCEGMSCSECILSSDNDAPNNAEDTALIVLDILGMPEEDMPVLLSAEEKKVLHKFLGYTGLTSRQSISDITEEEDNVLFILYSTKLRKGYR